MALGHGPISGGPIVDNTEDFGAAPTLFSRVDPSTARPTPLRAWSVSRGAWLATATSQAHPALPPAVLGVGPSTSGGGVFRGSVVVAVGSSFSHAILSSALPSVVPHDTVRPRLHPTRLTRPHASPVFGAASMPAFVSHDGPRPLAPRQVRPIHESTVQAVVESWAAFQPSEAWPTWPRRVPRMEASAWEPVGISAALAVFIAEAAGRVLRRPRVVRPHEEPLSASLVAPWTSQETSRPIPPRWVLRPDPSIVASAMQTESVWLSTERPGMAWPLRRVVASQASLELPPMSTPVLSAGFVATGGAVFRGPVLIAVVSAPVWPAIAAPGLLTWRAEDDARVVRRQRPMLRPVDVDPAPVASTGLLSWAPQDAARARRHRRAILRPVDSPIVSALVVPPGLLTWAPQDLPRVIRSRVWWLPIAGLGWTGFGPNGEIILPPTPPESLWDDANITPPGPGGSLYGVTPPGLGASPFDTPSASTGSSLFDAATGPGGAESPFDTPTVIIVIPRNLWDLD